ncbi:MAG: methyltransferase RsmF C-terminal domain-like protein [Sphingobacteriaceae bacterium]
MKYALPEALIDSLKRIATPEVPTFIQLHKSEETLTSVRMNPSKPSSVFLKEEAIGWSTEGKYLAKRPSFTADPLFHAGAYYVQEASSMFLEQALKQTDLSRALKVLDLCAAPGGKSTLLSSLLNDESLLLANELIKTRVPILSDNLIRWGKLNTYVSNNDPKDFERMSGFFDVIVVDAPCSGSGMFRKDPEAISQWSEDAVQLCSQRQQRILADIYPALKENGLLIYSTCSYSKEENEDICDWLAETFELESLRIPLESDWGIQETQSDKKKQWGYRFYPHLLKGEGFFLACFRKKEASEALNIRHKKEERNRISATKLAEINRWLNPNTAYEISVLNDTFLAIPTNQLKDFDFLREQLYLKKAGTRLGKFAGNDFIPDHELALSIWASGSIPRISLNREQALNYLKRIDFTLDTPLTGWALACYDSLALGWVKVLPKRLNNYYPKEWRIVNQNLA